MTISVKAQIQSLLQLPTTNRLFLIVSPRLDLTVLQPLIQRFSGHQLALFQSFSQPPTAADTLPLRLGISTVSARRRSLPQWAGWMRLVWPIILGLLLI